ncbi:hypothetical protein CPB83DRAFT_855454 [Crepidotus variabilis]|uniref:Transmembrane protein n=1 Tax=Crepidotus variabilis TaxID=179855 RepID=A0A9P6EF35_9AGAR|nr:hypothetical protein CPB83DRAFT_855454 [Crepidotus variabilis]
MANWESPDVQEQTLVAFTKFLHAVTGLYIWELMITSDLEWKVLTGRKPFRWPMISYFGSRWTCLAACLAGCFMLDMSHVNCHSTYVAVHVFTHTSLNLASVNFVIRTIAIWSYNRYIIVGLSFLLVGQLCLTIFQATTVTITTLPDGGCLPPADGFRFVLVIYAYSLCIDSIVILLTVWKLRTVIGVRAATYAHLIFKQGVGYYMIAFMFDLIAIIFMVLDPTFGLVATFNVAALVAVAIVASRAVWALSSASGKPVIEKAGGAWPHPLSVNISTSQRQEIDSKTSNIGQVFVQMETVTHRDDFHEDDLEKSCPRKGNSFEGGNA